MRVWQFPCNRAPGPDCIHQSLLPNEPRHEQRSRRSRRGVTRLKRREVDSDIGVGWFESALSKCRSRVLVRSEDSPRGAANQREGNVLVRLRPRCTRSSVRSLGNEVIDVRDPVSASSSCDRERSGVRDEVTCRDDDVRTWGLGRSLDRASEVLGRHDRSLRLDSSSGASQLVESNVAEKAGQKLLRGSGCEHLEVDLFPPSSTHLQQMAVPPGEPRCPGSEGQQEPWPRHGLAIKRRSPPGQLAERRSGAGLRRCTMPVDRRLKPPTQRV